MNITLEKQDDLNAVLAIEINPDDYQPKVAESLKAYRKQARIPGFRPGMAPMGVIRKMVGKSIYVDEVNKLANDALNKYLREKEVDILGEPLNSQSRESVIDFDQENDFIFYFDLGLSPQFELNFSEKDKLTRYKLEVDDTELDREVKNLCQRYGSLHVIETSEQDNDSLSGTLTELDDNGEILEGGVADKKTTVLLDMVKDDATRGSLTGVQVGDEVEIDIFKLFNDNERILTQTTGLPAEGVKDLGPKFRFSISEIKRFTPSEVDQSLFDKVFGEGQVSSEEDFRQRLRENLENYYASEAENHLNHEIQHLITDNHNFDLPDTFLKRWLMERYPESYTSENADVQYEREANGLRAQLVREKVIELHQAQITEEDINQVSFGYTVQMLRQYGMDNPDFETVRYFEQKNREDKNYLRQIGDMALNQKVTELIKGMVSIEEKSISPDAFYDMIDQHNEKHNH